MGDSLCMALTSASTLTNALAQYNDNLLWDGDVTKARLALEAIRWLLANRPAQTTREGVGINYADLAEEKKKLQQIVDGTILSEGSGRRTLAEFS